MEILPYHFKEQNLEVRQQLQEPHDAKSQARIKQRRTRSIERKQEASKRKICFTTPSEFAFAFHIYHQLRLCVKAEIYLPEIEPSTDIATCFKGVPRPNELRIWDDFIPKQMAIWDTLTESEFNLERHNFTKTSLNNIASEYSNITYFEKFLDYRIGLHIRWMIKDIYDNPVLRASLGLKGFVSIKYHHSEPLEPETSDDLDILSYLPPTHSLCELNTIPLNAQSENESIPEKRPAFIIQYKEPIDLRYKEFKDVIQPMNFNNLKFDSENSDDIERLRWIFASYITEAYSHMIEEGVEYGCICTIELTIFLRVLKDDGHNIYYHVSAPLEGTKFFPYSLLRDEEPDIDNKVHLTAMGQMIAFTIQAMKVELRTQNWRKDIYQKSRKWGEFNSSPSMNMSESKENDESKFSKKEPSHINLVQGDMTQYCTNECLSGLKNGGKLDKSCPNWREHGTDIHLISKSQFLHLMQQQLAEDLDNNFEPICVSGSGGVPFKARLASYGYTFFAKCSPRWVLNGLKHEARVYNRLEPIQGTHVPVYLGNIELRSPYFFSGGIKLFHAMFLSFGGIRIDAQVLAKEDFASITQKVVTVYQKIHELEVLHDDASPRNILWNSVTGQVRVTDFERSKLFKIKPTEAGNLSDRKKSKIKTKVSNVKVRERRCRPVCQAEIFDVEYELGKLIELGVFK